MILLLAVIAGLLAGMARARIDKRGYQPAQLRHIWLVIAAFLPQLLAFTLPVTRAIIPTWLAAWFLIITVVMLGVFVLLNIDQPGLLVLGLGLAMNLIVILANGGLMPISPESASRVVPEYPPETWQSGNRFGKTKDIILTRDSTRFFWLSDVFISPTWFPYRFVFSLGDVFIALGAFWVLWQGGAQKPVTLEQ